MNIREITVEGLNDFIHSKEYAQLDSKPITPERAVSQAKNPYARNEDVALVYIAEDNKLLAFAGILPDEAGEGEEPVFSNTGWWVNSQAGRKYGLPVFLKAYQLSNRRMFFTDCSEHTKSILDKTGLFSFHKPAEGLRLILQFYSGDFLRKKGVNRFLSGLFFIADAVLNFLNVIRIKMWSGVGLPAGYSIHVVSRIDEGLNTFIKKHSSNYYLKQDGEKLDWIVKYPWLATKNEGIPVSYPFSHTTKSFHQEFLVIKNKEQTVAVLLLSVRDRHASIPYIYYDERHIRKIIKIIFSFLYQKKVNSLITFHPGLLKVIAEIRIPAIFRMSIFRHSGYSKELGKIFSVDKWFQDGEGDVAFT